MKRTVVNNFPYDIEEASVKNKFFTRKFALTAQILQVVERQGVITWT